MALLVDIKVTPSASRQTWSLDAAGMLKCHLKSPPEKGRANSELVKLLATCLKCAQSDIEIIAGHTSRKKRLKIHGSITFQQLLHTLSLDVQVTLMR